MFDPKQIRYRGAFSASIEMDLLVGERRLSIGQMGPDFVVLRSAIEHPPGDAEILMVVDGVERRWWVHMPDGIHPDRRKTMLTLPPR